MLFSNQGAQGLLGKPSNQDLDNTFGTHVDTDVVKQILEKGKEESADGIRSSAWGSTNDGKGSFVDTKGGRNTSGV